MAGEEELCMPAELNPSNNPVQVFMRYSPFPVKSEAWSVGTASFFLRMLQGFLFLDTCTYLKHLLFRKVRQLS